MQHESPDAGEPSTSMLGFSQLLDDNTYISTACLSLPGCHVTDNELH